MTALILLSPSAFAGPAGGTVVEGSAGISQAGSVTNINQSSNKAIINWQGFSVGASETVNFNQPGVSSVTLNRVIGNETSVINGALNANGQVFIVNSAGVLFGKGSQVNVGGLVASTRDISNSDFMAGKYTFSGSSSASIVNQGHIRAHGGGYVALLGKTVSNDGVISANLGTVAMSSGDKLTLNFGGNSLVDVTIDKGTLNALVENKRAIRANGGQVIMTAKAADQLLSAQVNNSGIVQARTMAALTGGAGTHGTVRLGKIKMIADGGTTTVSGKLDASAPKGGDGGFIETSGNKVKIADSAVITTKSTSGKNGTWLIDPYNIIISNDPTANGAFDSGTPDNTFDPTGPSIVNVAMLQAALASNNVVIRTGDMGSPGTDAGDITVNAGVTWSADTTLTLNAANNININKAITANGDAAGLTLNAGRDININNAVTFSGANAKLEMNYGGYNGTTVMTPLVGTDYNIRTKASYSGAVLDATGKPVAQQDTSSGVYGGITFINSANLNGLKINGQTYTLIHNLSQLASISQPMLDGAGNQVFAAVGNYAIAEDFVDTAGIRNAPVLANLGVSSTQTVGLLPDGTCCVVITTPGPAGALAGLGHTIKSLNVDIPDAGFAGALIGKIGAGSTVRDLGLIDTNLNANYSGFNSPYAAALAGRSEGILHQVYASGGTITAGPYFTTSGLVGLTDSSAGTVSISDSFADISGVSAGLIGRMDSGGSVQNSHASADVSGSGLIGTVYGASISNSYATGEVTNGSGGLIGNYTTLEGEGNSVANSFARGNVNGNAGTVGGLIGSFSSGSAALSIVNSYATGDVTTNFPSTGVGGLIGVGNGTVVIDRAFATGNVYANGPANSGGVTSQYVGGLIGFLDGILNSTITNSYASGNISAPTSIYVGGLGGWLQGLSFISHSHYTGNILAYDRVGGLAGYLDGTNAGPVAITDWYSPGRITGLKPPGRDTFIAALVGQGIRYTTDPTVVFNAANGPQTGNQQYRVPEWGAENGRGLTGDQLKDAQFYADGTINQVLAARAAAAAFQSQAVQTGGAVTAAASDAAFLRANPASSAAGSEAASNASTNALNANTKAVEDNVKADDARQRQERRRLAALRSGSGRRQHRGGGYGATIRSIDVDGQRFDLQNNNNKGTPSGGQ